MSHTTGIDWEGYRGKYRLIDANLRKDEVINTPLGSWGWVLQERLLSTKKVYFSKNQVFWGYQEAQGCEASPSMLPAPMLTVPAVWQNLNVWHNGVQLSAWGKQSSGLEDFRLSAYALWDRIVQTYSGLAFTQNTNRLIALSGVAKVVATMIEDEYLAGIWRSRLPRGLIWSVNNPDTASRPESYVAPSWSLALVLGGVTCPADIPPDPNNVGNLIEAIDILDVSTSALSADQFGAISLAFIRLRGALCWATVGADGKCLLLEDGVSLVACADIGRLEEGWKLYCLPIYLHAGLCLELDGNQDGRYHRLGCGQQPPAKELPL
jgi:hypothetical protein